MSTVSPSSKSPSGVSARRSAVRRRRFEAFQLVVELPNSHCFLVRDAQVATHGSDNRADVQRVRCSSRVPIRREQAAVARSPAAGIDGDGVLAKRAASLALVTGEVWMSPSQRSRPASHQ
jgi:hypothetical protein